MRLVYVMIFFNSCSGCLCSDDDPEPSGCGTDCEPGSTRQCSCGCLASGEQTCLSSRDWGQCMCEPRFAPPDAPDANFDSGDLPDASRDVSVDISLPTRDAARDTDRDAISWLPTPDASELATEFDLRVASATAPTTSPDGEPWDPDGTPPDLLVEVETAAGVVLQTDVVTDSYAAEFTEDTRVRITITEPLRFTLRDIDEITPTGTLSEVVVACQPRPTDDIRTRGGVLQCKDGDATIEVRADPVPVGD